MKEYDISITETLQKTITVIAESQAEAEDLAHDQWSQGIHILDAEYFVDATITTKSEREVNLLDVLLIEPMKPPVSVQIPDTLEALQDAVGGLIQVAPFFDDPIEIICNEEGKLMGLPPNRAIYNKDGEIIDILLGSFIVVGSGEEDFISIPPDMKEKYAKEFEHPEKFYKLAGKIIAQKMEPTKEKDAKTGMER